MTPWVTGLRDSGFTNVRTVGFYAGDAHCTDNVPDRADNTVNTSIHELGRDLANLIYTKYTRQHRPVAVSAHSMGGWSPVPRSMASPRTSPAFRRSCGSPTWSPPAPRTPVPGRQSLVR